MMSFRRALLCVALALCGCIPAQGLVLPGPAGNVELQLSVNSDGHLAYAISSDGKTRLESSLAGIVVNEIDLGAGVELQQPAIRKIGEEFPWRGNKTTARNDCVVYEVPIRAASLTWVLEVRVFNDGAAFRYRVPSSGKRRVTGESTSWQIPPETVVWFQTDLSSYEGAFSALPVQEMPAGPVGLPVTLVFKDGTYGLISEAGLFRYSGLSLLSEPGQPFRAHFNDDASGWNQKGEIISPWRVVVLSKDLTGLINQDVIAALNAPPDPKLFPEGLNTPWILTGKALCTWMIAGNDGAHWELQKTFVDNCKDLGCEFLLVDAGWRTRKYGWVKDGVWKRAAELCRYGAEQGVGVILWHSYNDMSSQGHGPALLTPEAREEFLRRCAAAGVKGVKIDFFGAESKEIVEACEDFYRRAAKHKLTVNFHGVYKPTGEMRTWPHEITREAIREQEGLLTGALDLPHYGALPFTRFVVGHADFLPGFVNPDRLRNTTLGFQAAALMIFSSPFLCLPDHPEAYRTTQLRPLIRTIPVVWDETRVLAGSKIGELVIMARRKGEEWYIAAINCRQEPSSVEIDLNDLKISNDSELTIYRDGSNKDVCEINENVALPKDHKLQFTLRSGGGVLVQVHR